jgi:malonyl-CoA/methylmalonyl-CoA synthetase
LPNHLYSQFAGNGAAAHAPFLKTRDGAVITYGELWESVGKLARVLIDVGVRPGDRVAAQVEKTPPALMLYLACLKAGAVFLPLNPAYTPTEIGYFLADAEPALFVCDPEREGALAEAIADARIAAVETLDAAGEGSLVQKMRAARPLREAVARKPEDLAAILYTSGTTGRSKGAMLSHENLSSNARTLTQYWRFSSRDVLIHALPIFHTHGLFVACNVILMAGASMIFLARFDADEVLSLMPQATSLMGVPTFYTRLVSHSGLTREAIKGMRLFVSGSAPLLAETHRAFEEKTGQAILERYGMTETNMNSSNPYVGARMAGTVGKPLPGVDLRITDPDTGAILPQGEVGMIEVKGPNVFLGYWQMPEKTKAEFRKDGFFITGDLGRIDGRGYVHIAGRGKDLIITGGLNVYPREVEGEIDALPGVIESAVIGIAHPDFGEGVTAVLVAKPGADLSEASVLAAIALRLAKFKCPKRVIIVDELPRNTMGKVQKNVLRETYAGIYAGG